MKSRFCYSYQRPGLIETTCPSYPVVTSCPVAVANGNVQTTQGALLKYQQKQMIQQARDVVRTTTILNTIANVDSITKDIVNQTAQLMVQRYEPYRPYVYPVVPESVTQLQMMTANVGNPMPPMTIAKCKGSQFVTK